MWGYPHDYGNPICNDYYPLLTTINHRFPHSRNHRKKKPFLYPRNFHDKIQEIALGINARSRHPWPRRIKTLCWGYLAGKKSLQEGLVSMSQLMGGSINGGTPKAGYVYIYIYYIQGSVSMSQWFTSPNDILGNMSSPTDICLFWWCETNPQIQGHQSQPLGNVEEVAGFQEAAVLVVSEMAIFPAWDDLFHSPLLRLMVADGFIWRRPKIWVPLL